MFRNPLLLLLFGFQLVLAKGSDAAPRLLPIICVICLQDPHRRLLLVTVATEETDGYRRFSQSAAHFGYDVKVGEKTRGLGPPFRSPLLRGMQLA